MEWKRRWTQVARGEEECAKVLRNLDERTLQRRAKRLSMLVQVHAGIDVGHMPSRTDTLLSAACDCFEDGQYTGCVLTLATGVEHGLRQILDASRNSNLAKLIEKAVSLDVVNSNQAVVLRTLNKYRNNVAHSNIDNLAAGKTLQRQTYVVTQRDGMPDSEWVEFEPESQIDREMVVHFSEEYEVGQLLVEVREVLHDVFDRFPTLAGTFETGG